MNMILSKISLLASRLFDISTWFVLIASSNTCMSIVVSVVLVDGDHSCDLSEAILGIGPPSGIDDTADSLVTFSIYSSGNILDKIVILVEEDTSTVAASEVAVDMNSTGLKQRVN